jgi:hypothetical protein
MSGILSLIKDKLAPKAEEKEEEKGGAEEKEEEEKEVPVFISEVFGSLLGQERFSDVTFHVGDKKFPAHRLVLAACSPVFELMLFPLDAAGQPSVAADGPVQVTIKNVEPEAFASLLKCCYTDEVDVDASNVQSLIKLAGKYQVAKLKAACAELLEGDVNKDNALDLFILGPTLLGQDDFALSFIEENAEEVLASPSITKLPKDRLEVLLKSDKLACDEMIVFGAVQRWVAEQEKKEGWDRKQGLEVLKHVRFPTMEVSDIAAKIQPSGLLAQEQLVALLTYCAVPEAVRASIPAPPFPVTPREGGSWAWDPQKKGRNVTLSNKNLSATSTGSSWQGGLIMGTRVFTKGTHYWEIMIDHSTNDMVGLVTPDVNFSGDSVYSNQPAKCWFIHHSGSAYGGSRGTKQSYSGAMSTGTKVGQLLEWDEKTSTFSLSYYYNGRKNGTPFTRIPPPVCASVELYSSPARITLNSKAKKPSS